MRTKNFNYRGSRWNEIEAETNKNMQRAGFVIIKRPPSYWKLKRYGQMVASIDVKPEELPESVRKIAVSLAN